MHEAKLRAAQRRAAHRDYALPAALAFDLAANLLRKGDIAGATRVTALGERLSKLDDTIRHQRRLKAQVRKHDANPPRKVKPLNVTPGALEWLNSPKRRQWPKD